MRPPSNEANKTWELFCGTWIGVAAVVSMLSERQIIDEKDLLRWLEFYRLEATEKSISTTRVRHQPTALAALQLYIQEGVKVLAASRESARRWREDRGVCADGA